MPYINVNSGRAKPAVLEYLLEVDGSPLVAAKHRSESTFFGLHCKVMTSNEIRRHLDQASVCCRHTLVTSSLLAQARIRRLR
jgi:hypothetical protein